MGFIRGGLLVIASVLLLVALLAGNGFLTLDNSLEFSNVEPELTSVLKNNLETQFDLTNAIDDNLVLMEIYCLNNTEFVFSQVGQTFAIPCETVSQGSDAIVEHGINNLVEDFYYKEYDCDFLDCIEQNPAVLISSQAQNYANNKFRIALFASLILITVMFFLVESKSNLPILVGILLGASALPFAKLNSALSFIIGDSLNFSGISILDFLNIFISESYSVFLKSFILGIILISIGIILKFFKIGFKVSDFLSKFKKSEVKKDSGNITKSEVKKIVKNEIKTKSIAL